MKCKLCACKTHTQFEDDNTGRIIYINNEIAVITRYGTDCNQVLCMSITRKDMFFVDEDIAKNAPNACMKYRGVDYL